MFRGLRTLVFAPMALALISGCNMISPPIAVTEVRDLGMRIPNSGGESSAVYLRIDVGRANLPLTASAQSVHAITESGERAELAGFAPPGTPLGMVLHNIAARINSQGAPPSLNADIIGDAEARVALIPAPRAAADDEVVFFFPVAAGDISALELTMDDGQVLSVRAP